MGKRPKQRFLEDVPRPSTSSVLEAFYGGGERRTPRDLPIDQIDPNPHQPRSHFDPHLLTELTESIGKLGLIQAIVVRPVGDRYQIVCGERRFRACRALEMQTIRAEVRTIDEETAYHLALAENIQRDSLTPIEEAIGYRRLLDQKMTQAEAARTLGIDRRRISEKILLLALPKETQELLSARADNFTERHARVLAQAAGSLDVTRLAHRCIDGNWSTRRLEAEIARQLRPVVSDTLPRLFENIHYTLNKRGGFTLTVRARSRQEVARTISELDDKLHQLRDAFENELSARADNGRVDRDLIT